MELRHNSQEQYFQLWEDNNQEIGRIEYLADGEALRATHTYVDPAYEGHGYAAQLLDALISYAREQHKRIIPDCPYVAAKFRRSPEKYADVTH